MITIPKYVKDYYFLNSFIKFPDCKRLPILMEGRTVTYQMYSDFNDMMNQEKIAYNASNPAMLYVAFNRHLKEDGYRLEIKKNKKIYIEASNRRGIRYAIDLLAKLVTIIDNDVYLPIIRFDDEPSFKYRGIIEGFFGKPWSHEERLDEIDLMNRYRLNTFIYAPKDDEFHRKLWRIPYPQKEINQIFELKTKCSLFDIDFYYCISPGNDFDYNDENDFRLLFDKLDQVIAGGVKYFGILMDDIDYKLSDKNKLRFERPGIAHAYICNRVNEYLKKHIIDYRLIICPTEYHQNKDGKYRHDLSIKLDPDIAIFFTGDNVCAEVMTDDVIEKVQQDFNHPIYIWENHPVNDFLPNRLFTGPIANRSRNLPKYVDAYITNPMNQWLASRPGIISCAYYAWNAEGYCPMDAYMDSLDEFHDLMPDIKIFFDANRATVIEHYDNYRWQIAADKEEYEFILSYYDSLSNASKNLLNQSHPLIQEIKPWLERAIDEADIIKDILNQTITHERLVTFLSNPIRLGIECIDYLIKKQNLLSFDEYYEKVTKPRGNLWWRVWEDER